MTTALPSDVHSDAVRKVTLRKPHNVSWFPAPQERFELGLILVAFCVLRIIAATGHSPAHDPDSASYLQLNFLGQDLRLWTVPLLFSILPGDSARVTFQIALGVVSWSLLALSVWQAVQDRMCARGAAVLILCLGLVPQVTGWDNLILSESISTSLLVATIAVAMMTSIHPTSRRIGLLVVVLTLWVFCRQTNAIIFLCLVPFAVFLAATRLSGFQRICTGVALVAVALWSAVSLTAGGSKPILTLNGGEVVLNRIAESPSALRYFEAHGLRLNPYVEASIGNSNAVTVYGDRSLVRWVNTRFNSTYLQYMLTHPVYTFIDPLTQAPTYATGYVTYSTGQAVYTETPSVLPAEFANVLWGPGPGDLEFWIAVAGVLLAIAVRLKARVQHWLPAAFALAGACVGAIVIYDLSTNELYRLFIPVGVAARIGLVLLIALTVDALRRRRPTI